MVDLGQGETGRAPADRGAGPRRHKKGPWFCSLILLALLAGPIQAAAQADNAPLSRDSYAADLRQAFLSIGISMRVFTAAVPMANNPAKGTPDLYPRLVVMGPFGDALVYQAGKEARVVERATAAGFKSVEFYSTAGQGHYVFDLTGPAPPQCDTHSRVCF